MDYEIIEDMTHADVAVRIRGVSYSELFVKSGIALISEMLENPDEISSLIVKEGVISGDNIELLFFEFLNEILFFKDAESLLLLPETVSVIYEKGLYKCSFSLAGEKMIRDKHVFKVDIKAVTMHGLRIYKEDEIYIVETVFDV
jgi:SHS2 domain-containing protein